MPPPSQRQGFPHENIIGLLFNDLLRDVALAADDTNGDDRSFDHRHAEQLLDSYHLAELFRNLELPRQNALAPDEGRDYLDGGLRIALFVRSPRSIAINRDHPRRHAGYWRAPGLQLFSVGHGQDVAQIIVGQCAILERAKTTKQPKLFDPEQSDISEAVGSREQTQQEHLIEQVDNLANLARVLQLHETTQEDNRIRRIPSRSSPSLSFPSPSTDSRIAIHLVLCRFVANSRPIALALLAFALFDSSNCAQKRSNPIRGRFSIRWRT